MRTYLHGHSFRYLASMSAVFMISPKKMPGESGELEAMSYAFRGCTGLQHEVIAMASCCKKGGDSPSRETITAKHLELLASRSLGVILAWHAGFEPATNRLEGGCSVRLS